MRLKKFLFFLLRRKNWIIIFPRRIYAKSFSYSVSIQSFLRNKIYDFCYSFMRLGNLLKSRQVIFQLNWLNLDCNTSVDFPIVEISLIRQCLYYPGWICCSLVQLNYSPCMSEGGHKSKLLRQFTVNEKGIWLRKSWSWENETFSFPWRRTFSVQRNASYNTPHYNLF